MNNIPLILLAAGASSRMGQPKQLLRWGKKSLIEHQAKTLLATGNQVVVVLGNQAENIIPKLKDLPVKITINDNWEKGMGTSIVTGVEFAQQLFPDCKGVLISLVDQPLITTSYLKKLLDIFEPENQQIIVSQADSGWQGVPVLFDRVYFKALLELSGTKGAKSVFRKNKQHVIGMQCGDLMKDVDTPDQYKKLRNN